MVALVLFLILARGVAYASPSHSVSFDIGALSIGPGKGGLTLGLSGEAGLVGVGPLWLSAHGSASIVGVVGTTAPGFNGRALLSLAGEIEPLSMWLEGAAGADIVAFRACGTLNCGDLFGVVPSALMRGVWFGPYLKGALGITATIAAFWIPESDVIPGLNFQFSGGPLFRFGGKK